MGEKEKAKHGKKEIRLRDGNPRRCRNEMKERAERLDGVFLNFECGANRSPKEPLRN
jgi:hypothetical protein